MTGLVRTRLARGVATLALAFVVVVAGAACTKKRDTSLADATAMDSPPGQATSQAEAAPPADAVVAAPTADITSAQTFLEKIYAHYNDVSSDAAWNPFDAETGRRVFDPSLQATMQEYVRLMHAPGYETDDDWNPLCNCEDDSPRPSRWRISVKATGLGTATAIAQGAEKPIELSLVLVDGEWRVHDIREEGQSVRAALEQNNRKMKSRPAKAP